jgi:hypothetical protein
MSQDHLVNLARLSIESEIARKINFDTVITCIALKKARKAPLNAYIKGGTPDQIFLEKGSAMTKATFVIFFTEVSSFY